MKRSLLGVLLALWSSCGPQVESQWDETNPDGGTVVILAKKADR